MKIIDFICFDKVKEFFDFQSNTIYNVCITFI